MKPFRTLMYTVRKFPLISLVHGTLFFPANPRYLAPGGCFLVRGMERRTWPGPSGAVPVWQAMWFPAALLVLLLLALPGFIFLALHLFGKESTLNGWLKNHFGVTYHLATPWWTGVALLFVPLLLILLYFLKLKRKPLEVPSTFLWRKSIEDLHVNSLFQWLRDNVLLLVQLLIVLLLIYSVLALQVHGNTSAGKHYILLIDNSASMGVADVGKSRLEAAKDEALREIDSHSEGDMGMVIAFNSRASILQPYTSDRDLLRAAVNRIAPTQRPTRIDEALRLADSLANPLRSTDDAAVRPANEDPAQARTYVAAEGIAAEVHLFSDGRFPDVSGFAAGNLDLNYHRIGKAGPDACRQCRSRDAQRRPRRAGSQQTPGVRPRLLNFRAEAATVKVEMEWRVPGKDEFNLLDQNVAMAGRKVHPAATDKEEAASDVPGEGVAVFSLGGVDDSANVVVHVRLRDVHDGFPLDDEAWLVVGVVPQGARADRHAGQRDSPQILRPGSDGEGGGCQLPDAGRSQGRCQVSRPRRATASTI